MSRTKKAEETVEAQEVAVEEVAEEVQEMQKEEVQEVKQKEAVTYLGPTIRNVVEYGTVFTNGTVTKILEEKMKQAPILKSLLIPTSGLVKAKKELGNYDSALSAIYRKAKEVMVNE